MKSFGSFASRAAKSAVQRAQFSAPQTTVHRCLMIKNGSLRQVPVNEICRRTMSVDVQGTSVTNSASTFDPRFFFNQNLSGDAVEKLRRALLYRSRQTGWLETDVIMGKWAEKNLERLSVDELRQYSDIVKEEIMDIFKWITGQLPVPERVDNQVMRELQAFALRRNS